MSDIASIVLQGRGTRRYRYDVRVHIRSSVYIDSIHSYSMTEIIECDRCEIETEFTHYRFELWQGHKVKTPIFKCPKCGLEFDGDETLA